MASLRKAVKMRLYGNNGDVMDYTVADGNAIAKNSVLTITDPNTAADVSSTGSAGAYDFAGIAVTDKEASDGSTRLGAWTNGDFKVYASGSITINDPLKSCGDGYFMTAIQGDFASHAIVGWAKETASANETFIARILI